MYNKIICIGIGNMGYPIARNLIRLGYHVTVFDKNIEKIKQLVQEGAFETPQLQESITIDSIVITMLPDDDALLNVVVGQGRLASLLGKNNIHISMSTVSPETTQKIYLAHQRHNTQFISAPVLGRPEAAEAQKLWIFASGKNETKNLVFPILECLSQKIYDFGEDVTSSNHIKLAMNFLILSAIEAMGEAFTFIEKNGLNKELFADMICHTLFACPAYQYHANNIATRTFLPAGFRSLLGLKDINLLLQTAQNVNTPMPMANLLQNKLLLTLAKKRADLDWSAITMQAAEDAGLIIKEHI